VTQNKAENVKLCKM